MDFLEARVHRKMTFGLDIDGLVSLLSIPAGIRKPGIDLFTQKLLNYWDTTYLATVQNLKSYRDASGMSFATLASAQAKRVAMI